MDLLKSLKKFAGNWSLKEVVAFSAEEMAEIDSARVQYSKNYPDKLCVCFHLRTNNQRAYMPLAEGSSLKEGDMVDMSTHKVLVLGKPGEDDIYRFDGSKIAE